MWYLCVSSERAPLPQDIFFTCWKVATKNTPIYEAYATNGHCVFTQCMTWITVCHGPVWISVCLYVYACVVFRMCKLCDQKDTFSTWYVCVCIYICHTLKVLKKTFFVCEKFQNLWKTGSAEINMLWGMHVDRGMWIFFSSNTTDSLTRLQHSYIHVKY